MTKKEKVTHLELDMDVFHEKIYGGNESMKIVGIRKTEVELEGDFSGGTHNTIQKEWFPIEGLFMLRKVCKENEKEEGCQLHNLRCSYPICEPYLKSDHHYEKNGAKVNH